MALIFGSKYSFVLRQQFASEIILRTNKEYDDHHTRYQGSSKHSNTIQIVLLRAYPERPYSLRPMVKKQNAKR